MNGAVQARLRFIDTMLEHYGSVGRAIIMDYFGMGGASASRDLALYNKLAPHNMVFDNSSKLYLRGPNFERKFP
jgi:hypothetical protein